MEKKSVSDQQKSYILEIVEHNASIIKEINFSPDKFFKLVETNKNFACDFFFILSNTPYFMEYLDNQVP